MSALSDKLEILLMKNGVTYEIIHHSEITCVEDGVQLLRLPESQILKTIGFSTPDFYAFVVLQGEKRIDYSKLSAGIGVKRKELKMLSPSVIENELGYEVGGLSPLHISGKVKVFFDSEILMLDTVYCAIGLRSTTLRIAPKSLLSVSNGILLDIAKE